MSDQQRCLAVMGQGGKIDLSPFKAGDLVAQLNGELIGLYMEAAQAALDGAQFNLDGGYPGIAANRAYYAFFYAASALLLTRDIKRSKHSGVIAAFREQFVKTGQFAPEHSDAFGDASDAREVADYDMVVDVEESHAGALLTSAQAFIAEVDSHLRNLGYS